MLKLKKSALLKLINNSLTDLPTPSYITYIWNFGFILAIILGLQIVTGLLLTIHYSPNISLAFSNLVDICRNVNSGWLLRISHANGASLFFILLYLHVGRGIYYQSFNLKETWNFGTLILLVRIITAFFGYVLPWGQISFWGATVITNLLSVVPYLGKFLVEWVWGGFSVSNPTLNRFYTFHFIMPFVILVLVILHLIFLHETGSTNIIGTSSDIDKIIFHPFFSLKDLFSFLVVISLFLLIVLEVPYKLGDPENFILANPLVTPIHIQPEWYLLFAYSILRAIPNKLGGVVALALSIIILFRLSLIIKTSINRSRFLPTNKFLFWSFLLIILLLTWLGMCPVEPPFIILGQIITCLYFSYFFVFYLLNLLWIKIL